MSSDDRTSLDPNVASVGEPADALPPDSAIPVELQRILFRVAAESIATKLKTGELLEVDPECYPPPLREPRATFVTLRVRKKLRGCMGSLTVRDPLVADVAFNAVASATRDPRFPPVELKELPQLDIHISILSPSEPLEVSSEEDLLAAIRPGIDGLIVREGSQRGTLLPAVWEHVATPAEFLMHLKRKAGLTAGYWSDTIRFERYTAQSLHQPVD